MSMIMFYSVICPCYNCDNTIVRVLESIAKQNENSLEVILVDDTSDHSFVPLVQPYVEDLNIKIVTPKVSYHNPGCSRQCGLEHASGDWVLFIDCDDEFRDGAFQFFRMSIEQNDTPCHMSLMKQFHPSGREFREDEEYQAKHIVWLHGKCYNRLFLIDHNIKFDPKMMSCEDYYFNYQVLAHMLSEKKLYAFMNVYTYNWLWNSNSLSRSSEYFIKMSEHMNDHVKASITPWTMISSDSENQLVYYLFLQQLMFLYFNWQYYLLNSIAFDKQPVRDALKRIKGAFGLSILDIINSVENDYNFWNNQYNIAIKSINESFVCPQSFRTWLMSIFE